MKKIFSLIAIGITSFALTTSADLVVGFDAWVDADTNNASSTGSADISGYITENTGNWSASGTNKADIDGTFGTVSGASTEVSTRAYYIGGIAGTNASLNIVIENNGTGAVDLDSFNFDAMRQYGGSASAWGLEVISGSGITSGSIGNGSFVTSSSTDYLNDIDVSLTSLTDHTLSAGETATFKLTVSGASGAANVYVDNVAVMGTIPEPMSLGLFVLGATGLMAFRKRPHPQNLWVNSGSGRSPIE